MIDILTYNDLLEIGENERDRMAFVLDAIDEHKASETYKTARDAELYYKHQNPTIMNYQKFLYNRMGQKVPDIWSANNKIASNWYYYFTTQAVQYLLGNGVTFKSKKTKEKLGKKFDEKLQTLATHAKNGGVAFGFWNYDHIEVFPIADSDEHPGFVPLYDEDDGALKAGVRYWQIDSDKPLRATLYEMDGYTDYIKPKKEPCRVLNPKRSYIQIVKSSKVDGVEITPGGNYPGFPIVPLRNTGNQSDLVGNRGPIDAYDWMQSGLINNVSEGEVIYWVLQNCNGMDDVDDAKFIERLKTTHVAHVDGDEGANAQAHEVNVPFEATEAALKTLENRLYNDFMAVKVSEIQAGNVTATQIKSAYEPINQKTDQFEYQVTEFINGILALAGIDDEPTYTRSQMSNRSEMLETILQAAEYLDDEYVTTKVLTLLGDADKASEVLKRKDAEAADRYKQMETELEELRNQQNNEQPEEKPVEE